MPAELKASIYGMVFQYPISGIEPRIDRTRCVAPVGTCEFAVVTRSLDERIPGFRDWEARIVNGETMLMVKETFKDILAPLLVNRQFHQEALPCFFTHNHFRFGSVSAFVNFLGGLTAERRQYIAHVSLMFDLWPGMTMFRSCAWLLLQLEGLKEFHVRIDEQMWRLSVAEPERFQDVAEIPWINTLRKIRGLEELTFTDCPGVEALVRTDMLMPKKVEEGSKSARQKRKIEDEQGNTGLRRSTRSKKAKS